MKSLELWGPIRRWQILFGDKEHGSFNVGIRDMLRFDEGEEARRKKWATLENDLCFVARVVKDA